MKKNSKQSIQDRKFLKILQDESSTNRDKQKSFESLYKNHENQMSIFFFKHGNNKELIEDLKNMTFEKVYKNIKSYNHKFAFSTWMYKIAMNTMIDLKRKNKEFIVSLDELISNDIENLEKIKHQFKSSILDPEQKLIETEEVKKIIKAINEIKDLTTRKLMKHRFIDGMSFKEIAEKIGIENNSSLRVKSIRESKKIAEKLK